LQAVLLDEAVLQRVERPAGVEVLDGSHLVAVGLGGEGGAALDREAI